MTPSPEPSATRRGCAETAEVIDGEIIVETPETTEYVASNGKELVLEGEILDTDTPTRSRGPQY